MAGKREASRSARTPEELESLLEDALILRDSRSLRKLFEPGACLMTSHDPPVRNLDEIVRLALATWGGDHTYVADPHQILVARDLALIIGEQGIHVAHRDRDGAWQYVIVLQAVEDGMFRSQPWEPWRSHRSWFERRTVFMDTHRTAIVLAPAEGEALWCVGSLTTVKAAAEQTAGAYSIIEDLAPKGAGTPLHRHCDDDEAFYVLDGEMTFYLGNAEPIRASAGWFVHIPGGTVHAFRVDSETARYLIITSPQHERFYRAIAEPAKSRTIPPQSPMDMEKIGAACEAYAVEGVGPMPEA